MVRLDQDWTWTSKLTATLTSDTEATILATNVGANGNTKVRKYKTL